MPPQRRKEGREPARRRRDGEPEPPARKSARRRSGSEDEPTRRDAAPDATGDSGPDSRLTARKAAQQAAEQVAVLTGREPESVTSLERTDDGWQVGVEVLETHRVPDSTDVLAVYRVLLDNDGELVSYRRAQRYYRGRAEEERADS